MVPLSQWPLFAGTALLMVVTPGPNMIYLVLLRFVSPQHGSGFARSIMPGMTRIAISFSFTFDLLIAMSAVGLLPRFAHRPARRATQRHVIGSVLGGLAVRMAFEQRRLA